MGGNRKIVLKIGAISVKVECHPRIDILIPYVAKGGNVGEQYVAGSDPRR